jgi:prolyl-tRNA editing enzyme YbaK/EbsC (Cys-tRNA(Pro) deacylase)
MTKATLTTSDLKAFLDQHALQANLVELDVPTPTVEAAAAAVGVDASHIVKSLLFWVGSTPIIVVASGPTLVDRRLIARHFGVGRKKVKLMPAADVLDISGYSVGAVPPFGHREKIMTLMDERLLDEKEVFAGGGAGNTLLRVSPHEIQEVTQATMLDLQPTELDRDSDRPS